MQQNIQEQNIRPPLITLSLVGAQSSNNNIPIVFKPLKDNGTTEFRPQRSFDASALLSSSSFRQKKPLFEIKLPYPKVDHIATSQTISSKPYSPEEYPNSILFSTENIEPVFSKLTEGHQIKISPEIANEILSIITRQLYEILIRAAQSSRQRTNVYLPPVAEREITSSPKIKQNFLDCEVFLANNIRNKLFNNNKIDENNPYEPEFYKNYDIKKTDLFPPESNEKGEQTLQMKRIFHTLKYRGEMFKTVAHEVDSTFSNEMDKYIASSNALKNDKVNLSVKPNSINPKVNEIFGGAEEEEKRKKDRQITPKDIFEALSRMPRLFKSEIPLWRLKYFEQIDAFQE